MTYEGRNDLIMLYAQGYEAIKRSVGNRDQRLEIRG